MKKVVITMALVVGMLMGLSALLTACNKTTEHQTVEFIDKVQLGKLLFFDKNLSNPIGQSCASCHNPNAGFSDAGHSIVSQGVVPGLFGNRNAPSIGYLQFVPSLYYDNIDSNFVGGFFLDGRANSLEAQVHGPLLNPIEMNNTNAAMVIEKIKQADYYPIYQRVYGAVQNNTVAMNNIADAIASYERSPDLNAFTSKYDYYLKGQATLTAQEKWGLQLFNDTAKGKCASCHISEPDDNSGKVLFTDFTYDNIGVPRNEQNPFYTIPNQFNPLGRKAIDYGLGGFLKNPDNYGQFKVPSLRNVAVSAPYFHNGFFNTLEEVVHFYNKRDVENFPAAEVPATVNKQELGNLKLTKDEEAAIVAFMKTLTDGYK